MTQEAYNLQVILELRELARDDARDSYAHEVHLLEERKRDVLEAKKRLKESVVRRQEACARFDARTQRGEASIAELGTFDDYVRALRADEVSCAHAIERAQSAVCAQERKCVKAQDDLQNAACELEAVEQHHEQWQQEQKITKQRKDESAMDEIAARLWRDQKP